MKRLLTLALILIFHGTFSSFAQTKGIRFQEKSWAELLAMSKQENKLIFLDGYATWCGPCKWMAANIFPNDTVGQYYNNHFICASFDMEKGEGQTIRSTYDIRAYPTLLFITPEGKMVHKRVGAPQKLQDYLDMGAIAMDPEHNYAACSARYNAGDRHPEFILEYCQRLADAYTPATEVLQDYFAKIPDQQITSRINWNILRKFVNDPETPAFKRLVEQRDVFANNYTADSVDNKISEVYLNALVRYTRNARMTEEGYQSMKAKVRASGFQGAEKVCVTSDLMLYQMRGNKEQFLDLAYHKVDQFFADDPVMLNNFAQNFSMLSDESKYVHKALNWAKKSIELKSEPYNNDTYARLLFKSGEKEEARKYERIAIALAKERNQPVSEYEAALKAME